MIRWISATIIAVVIGVMIGAGSVHAAADAWPQRAVRLIVPVGPGTAVDGAARVFAEKLRERWHQPVVVENRPGGDGVTGVAAFARLTDDNSLLFAPSTAVAVLPVIHDDLPYDPARDLVPIATATDIFIVIAATKALPARSMAELVALARARPGALNWAAGPGLPQYVFAAFLKSAGLDLALVSYREVGPALQDLARGRIDVLVHALGVVQPILQSGDARLLAVANSQRASIVPDVPTVIEAGFPELRMDGFCGFYGRRGMADALRERLAHDVEAIAHDPAVVSRLIPLGQIARASTPAEFTTALQAQRDRVAAIAAALGPAMPK